MTRRVPAQICVLQKEVFDSVVVRASVCPKITHNNNNRFAEPTTCCSGTYGRPSLKKDECA